MPPVKGLKIRDTLHNLLLVKSADFNSFLQTPFWCSDKNSTSAHTEDYDTRISFGLSVGEILRKNPRASVQYEKGPLVKQHFSFWSTENVEWGFLLLATRQTTASVIGNGAEEKPRELKYSLSQSTAESLYRGNLVWSLLSRRAF